jgi:hypothetical protein
MGIVRYFRLTVRKHHNGNVIGNETLNVELSSVPKIGSGFRQLCEPPIINEIIKVEEIQNQKIISLEEIGAFREDGYGWCK